MQSKSQSIDPWPGVSGLSDASQRYFSLDLECRRRYGKEAMRIAQDNPIDIKLIVRLSPKRVALSWSHAQVGAYTDQLWSVAVTTRSGICALTGKEIKAGNVIYRPRRQATGPINGRAMILASEMDQTV